MKKLSLYKYINTPELYTIIYLLNNFMFILYLYLFLYLYCIYIVFIFLYLYYRDVDQVHDMMDDIAEQQDVAREISDAISNPVAFGQDADEDELEKELEELQQEQLDKELLGIDTTTDELPAVPTSVPVAPSKTRTSNYYFYNIIINFSYFEQFDISSISINITII